MRIKNRCQVAGRDARTRAKRDGTLNYPFELADVSRPVVALERFEGVTSEAEDVFPELLRETIPEMFGQKLDIRTTKPEWRRHQAKGADPVINLGTEPSLFNERRQVFAAREHKSDSGPSLHPRMARGRLDVLDLEFPKELKLDF